MTDIVFVEAMLSDLNCNRCPPQPCVAGESVLRETLAFAPKLKVLPHKAAKDARHDANCGTILDINCLFAHNLECSRDVSFGE